MQVNIVWHDCRTHQGCNRHPVSAVRNLKSEKTCKNCAPVRFRRKCTDQEDHAHQHDQRREEILYALIASGVEKRERDHAEDQCQDDLGRSVVRCRDRCLDPHDRSREVSCLISDVADKDSGDHEDRDQDSCARTREFLSECFTETHT